MGKHKGSYVYLFLVLFLITVNIFLVGKYKISVQGLEKAEFSLQEQRTNYSNEIDFLNRYIEGTTIKTVINKELKNDFIETYSELNEALQKEDKVVFFYPRDACSLCLNKVAKF